MFEGIQVEQSYRWGMLLEELRERGLQSIELIVADGLKGLEDAAARVYGQADFQRCVTHAKRRLPAQVRSEDKPLLAEDLREVFLKIPKLPACIRRRPDTLLGQVSRCKRWFNW